MCEGILSRHCLCVCVCLCVYVCWLFSVEVVVLVFYNYTCLFPPLAPSSAWVICFLSPLRVCACSCAHVCMCCAAIARIFWMSSLLFETHSPHSDHRDVVFFKKRSAALCHVCLVQCECVTTHLSLLFISSQSNMSGTGDSLTPLFHWRWRFWALTFVYEPIIHCMNVTLGFTFKRKLCASDVLHVNQWWMLPSFTWYVIWYVAWYCSPECQHQSLCIPILVNSHI